MTASSEKIYKTSYKTQDNKTKQKGAKMEETITIKKIDYDLLIGQNKDLLQQNKSLQEQLLREINCSAKVLKAYCSLIQDIIKNGNEMSAEIKTMRKNIKEEKIG